MSNSESIPMRTARNVRQNARTGNGGRSAPNRPVPDSTDLIYLFICWSLIAQSTAQGHLRAFHKIKFHTSWIQYKTGRLIECRRRRRRRHEQPTFSHCAKSRQNRFPRAGGAMQADNAMQCFWGKENQCFDRAWRWLEHRDRVLVWNLGRAV